MASLIRALDENYETPVNGVLSVDAAAGVLANDELTGAADASVNKIKGYFIPDSDHIVGTIMALANDPLGQPNGTLGPFLLVPFGRVTELGDHRSS